MSTVRRKKTERVGSFRIFDVWRHEIVDGEGRATRDAFTFTCPDWVSVVPVTADGKFILVRQYRHGIDASTLEIPGGLIDEGQDPAGAAARELREETGYGEGTLVSLGATQANPALQNNRYHMFLAKGVRLLGGPEFDPGEYCELVVMSERDVRAQIRDGSISHALVLLALARAFEVLGEPSIEEVMSLVSHMEEQQARKVNELARRLRPGVATADIKNPHDFPGLEDTKWRFENGQLAGIQSVAAALRALRTSTS